MQFTKLQQDAINMIKKWFKSASKQYFVLSGFAGTGKTTLIKYAVNELDISFQDISFVAYTGKAALALTRKGTPATTIHKLIYETQETIVPILDKYGNPVLDKHGNPKTKKVLKYKKKIFLDLNIKLIVVDEYSMVSQDIWKDLLSFGVPILVTGDPG